MSDLIEHAGIAWLIAALVMAGLELVVPGVFLIFLAAAAALTGALALLFPDLGFAGQAVCFAGWSTVAVILGKRWYGEFPVETTDPLLNDRVARMVGEVVTVVQAIEDGSGRVRVGDGEWPAEGPDAPVGTRMRIIAARGTALKVEPLPPRISPPSPQ